MPCSSCTRVQQGVHLRARDSMCTRSHMALVASLAVLCLDVDRSRVALDHQRLACVAVVQSVNACSSACNHVYPCCTKYLLQMRL